MHFCDLRETGEESTAIKVGNILSTGLQSSTQAENQGTDSDGPSSAQVITSGSGQCSSKEGTSGKHGHHQTAFRLY
jgi:hypothetical protein